MRISIVFIIFSLFSAFAQAKESAQASLINNDGDEIGIATFTQGTQGVVIRIKAENMPEGVHGMHFHKVGDCSDHAGFKNAKGHISPHGKPHGFLNAEGPHEGNLPNLIVPENGKVHIELYSEMVSVKGHGGKPTLLDADGSTLMIHINEDDHKTQPIGGAGARIACGVVN